jgi:hypothetical protein
MSDVEGGVHATQESTGPVWLGGGRPGLDPTRTV